MVSRAGFKPCDLILRRDPLYSAELTRRKEELALAIEVVPGVGFGPTRPKGQRILSPPRLPFQPPGQIGARCENRTRATWVEARGPATERTVRNWVQRLDLNQRPSRYERDELPDCSTLPQEITGARGVGKMVASQGPEP